MMAISRPICRLQLQFVLMSIGCLQLHGTNVNFDLPPLGWNSWFAFRSDFTSANIRANADAMVSLGLTAVGYSYINLDASWQSGRFANGSVYENRTKIPEGMRGLADYIHSKGLLFGAYTDRGTNTCTGGPGSKGHEQTDATSYAVWTLDFIKSDSCSATQNHDDAISDYGLMQKALNASGRPIYFSLCGWYKWYANAVAATGTGQSYRIGPDALSYQNFLINLDSAADTASFARPGMHPDIDEISNTFTADQVATQLSAIAVTSSPLLLSFDLTQLTPQQAAPFANPEVIAVHQDAATKWPFYGRIAGGPLSPYEITPLTNQPCNASDPAQQWKLTPTVNVSAGTLTANGLPGWCLSALHAWYAECGREEQVWLAHCGSGSSACCGDGCPNQQWSVNSDGSITSVAYVPGNPGNVPGPYVTVELMPNTVFLNPRFGAGDPRSAGQNFTFDRASGQLCVAAEGRAGRCTPGAPACVAAPQPATTNVWYRALAGGTPSWALLFINTGPAAARVTCDAACFARAGVPPHTAFDVRDIRARADVGQGSSDGYAVSNVPANGGSAFYKFTSR